MFCSKCGNQIEDGSRFCQYCGSTQEVGGENQSYSIQTGGNEGILMGMSAVELLICGMYILVAYWWTNSFLTKLKGSWQTFNYLGADAKFIGMILYIVPFVLVVGMAILGIVGVKDKEYHISTGVVIGVAGLLVKIGAAIFDAISYKTYAIIAYRIFAVYGAIGLSTVVMGILIVFLLYAKTQQGRN